MRIQLIYWSVTWKVELFKKNVKILNTVYNRHFKSFQKIEKRYPDSQSELLKLPDPVKAWLSEVYDENSYNVCTI